MLKIASSKENRRHHPPPPKKKTPVWGLFIFFALSINNFKSTRMNDMKITGVISLCELIFRIHRNACTNAKEKASRVGIIWDCTYHFFLFNC